MQQFITLSLTKSSHMNSKQDHWENIYKTRDHKQLGWYQNVPQISLTLLSQIKAKPSQSIIDVGCGASTLVDHLIELDYRDIVLVDLSNETLLAIKNRLGEHGDIPTYLCEDITQASFTKAFDIWHDRAVFHFLTEDKDRTNYMTTLNSNLSSSGRAIIGTFSLNGPTTCSGLPIMQYDEEKMRIELAKAELELIDSVTDIHTMPNGSDQEYLYFIIKHKHSS